MAILRKKLFPWILLAAYIGVVCFLCFGHFSAVPGIKSSYFGIASDKYVHYLMFVPFPFLTYLCLNYRKGSIWKTLAVALLLTITGVALGALCEWGQSLTAYRTGDGADLLADFLGALTGAAAMIMADRNRKEQ